MKKEDLISDFMVKPWLKLPEFADYYSLRNGKYTPTEKELIKHFHDNSIEDLKKVIRICEWQSSVDPLGVSTKIFIENTSDIELIEAVDSLGKLVSNLDENLLINKLSMIIASSYKTKKKLIDEIKNTEEISEQQKNIRSLSKFIRSLDPIQPMGDINDYIKYQIGFENITSYIEDIAHIAEQFEFEDELIETIDSKGKAINKLKEASDYFAFIANMYLPKVPEILDKLSIKLELLKKSNLAIKQKNSKHIEIQHFCRSLIPKIKGLTGKPCYRVSAQITSFVFKNHFDIDISEDYVKQIYRGSESRIDFDDFKGII